MKASEIFKEFGEDYKWLTKDSDGELHIWNEAPYQHFPNLVNRIGWWTDGVMAGGVWVSEVNIDEFEGLSWDECIICRDIVEETFTTKDMIEFVKWTNVIYRDLSHTFAIKDVEDVNELLELFKQIR